MLNLKKNYVDKNERLAFAFAGGGQNFCYALVTNYLMYYYINIFGVDPKAVGLMLFVAGIWDIINNPLAGIVIDKTRTKSGKMIPYLRWLTPPLAVFTVLLFSGPQLLGYNSPFKVLYMVITYFCWELCYTFTDVSYWGLSCAISPNSEERAEILKTTNIIITIMSAIPQVLIPIFLDYAEAKGGSINLKNLFFFMGLFGGGVGVALFSMSGIFVKERIEQSKETPSIKESLGQLIKNPVLRIIITSNFLYSLSGIGLTFSVYYFIDVLGYASLSVLSQIPVAVFGFVSYALISPVKRKLDNRQIMIAVLTLLGTVQLTIFLIGTTFYNNARIMIPLIMVSNSAFGLASAFMGITPSELLGEATDYTQWTTGKRNEGISFSLKIATTKMSSTITQALGAVLLSMIGYITSPSDVRVPQPESVQSRLWVMFYLVPAVITLLSAIPYYFYPLLGEKKRQMYEELEERRKM